MRQNVRFHQSRLHSTILSGALAEGQQEDTMSSSDHVIRRGTLRYGAPRQGLMLTSINGCTDMFPSNQLAADEECSICFEKLKGSCNLVKLKLCPHVFHQECLREALRFDPKCPVCRKNTTEPQGKMPSGKMTIELDKNLACEGYEPGTWLIRYSMKAGVQKAYHYNPGVPYPSTVRKAFIPNTKEGRNLLKRVTYAFSRGLTFTVGTSLTSGKDNVIIW